MFLKLSPAMINYLRRSLAVIGVGAMLAQEVLVGDVLRKAGLIGAQHQSPHGHLGKLFKNHGIVHGIGRVLAPGEGTMR